MLPQPDSAALIRRESFNPPSEFTVKEFADELNFNGTHLPSNTGSAFGEELLDFIKLDNAFALISGDVPNPQMAQNDQPLGGTLSGVDKSTIKLCRSLIDEVQEENEDSGRSSQPSESSLLSFGSKT